MSKLNWNRARVGGYGTESIGPSRREIRLQTQYPRHLHGPVKRIHITPEARQQADAVPGAPPRNRFK